MPDIPTVIKFKFSHELFERPVREIVFHDVPERTVDGAIKDVGMLVTYLDGTQDAFYITMSARRPVGARDPREIDADPTDP